MPSSSTVSLTQPFSTSCATTSHPGSPTRLREVAAATRNGRSSTADNTVRFNGIAAKTSAFTEIGLDDTILGVADRRLIPDGGTTQISDTQLIAIGPGEPAQYLHRDQTGWPWFNQYLPDGPEVIVIAMLAVTDCTADNGATRVVPGSHLLADSDDLFDPARSTPAEMSAGSVLLFSGKTIHGGGANHTADQWRQALHISYLLGWLRPEEAHVLSVPPAIGAALPRRAQELLGFAEYNPAPHGGGRLWLVDFEDPARLLPPTAAARRLQPLPPGARSDERTPS